MQQHSLFQELKIPGEEQKCKHLRDGLGSL